MGFALRNNKEEGERKLDSSPSSASAYIKRRNWLLSSLLDLLIFLPLVSFIAFYDLNSPSINYRDETTHVRAVQEMRQSGQWWLPTVRGKPYLNKPPFKMWLTNIPLQVFGESAFSYRFLDALAGLLTCIAVYFFTRARFASRLAGIVAATVLVLCPAYVFSHGIRKAVQDSMLIFLCTLATMSGWYLLQALWGGESKSRQYKLAALTGLIIGLALMTKSVAGFVPLLVGGTFVLVSGKLKPTLETGLKPGLLLLGIALLIPSLYVVPHCLFTEGACGTIFQAEVIDRAVEGYHNSDTFWFYFIRVFKERQAVAPELLIPALCFGLYMALKRRSSIYLFALSWALVPMIAYTFYPSRLTWYVSPAFPGMAILSGALIASAFATARRTTSKWWAGESYFNALGLLACAVLLSGAIGTGIHFETIASGLFSLKPRHRTDLLTEEILQYAAKHPEQGRVLSYDAPPFSLHESTYGGMLEPLITRVSSTEDLFTQLKSDKFTYVISSLEHADELFSAGHVSAYRYLGPIYDRNRWMMVLSFRPELQSKELTSVKKFLDFGTGETSTHFGIGQRELLGHTLVQRLFGNSASFPVEGDSALKRFGSSAELNMLVSSADKIILSVKLNTEEVFRKEMNRSGLRSQRFQIPPGVWKSGENTIFIQVAKADGTPVSDDDTLVTLNWISFSLGQKKIEEAD